MKKYIQNFKSYSSENLLPQELSTQWLAQYHGENHTAVIEHYGIKSTDIEGRQVYAKGAGPLPFIGDALYHINEPCNPTIEQRSDHAQEKMEEIFHQLYHQQQEIPQHLYHVSCTHYQSPSAEQKMVVNKEWCEITVVTHLYHMGCHAALPAIRVSTTAICDDVELVDIVHTELCTFHLDKEHNSAEQTIMKTLFADGAIKYSLTSEKYFLSSKKSGFEVIAQKEILLPNTEKEMSWKIGSHGFQMNLTKSVPIILAKKIEKFMRELFTCAHMDYDQMKEQAIFAVHPGGPKIIELVERILGLKAEQVSHSKKILKTRGNMSSATIPYIWNEILEDQSVKNQTIIATVAFGPGLTMTGAVLKLCRH